MTVALTVIGAIAGGLVFIVAMFVFGARIGGDKVPRWMTIVSIPALIVVTPLMGLWWLLAKMDKYIDKANGRAA